MAAEYSSRRRYTRIPLKTRCWCVGDNATLYVHIYNASLGGLFIKTSAPFPTGEKLKIRWEFPGTQGEHQASAEVVWFRDDREPPGMGVKFVDVPEATRAVLEKLAGPEDRH